MNATPYYSFNRKKFVEMLREYSQQGLIFYPIKANDDELIVTTAIEKGCGFEVDSIEHIEFLVRRYNTNPEQIIYSFPIKKAEDIARANKLGIRKYAVDSLDEYLKVLLYVDKPQILIRLNANLIVGGLTTAQDKWGFTVCGAKSLIKDIQSKSKATIWGISFYLCSEINSTDNFRKLLKAIEDNFSHNVFEVIDIGGGISIDMLSELSSDLKSIKTKLKCKEIVLEPGRHLLDPCVTMQTSVLAIKTAGDGLNIAFIDASIYNGLIDVIIKNKRFEIELIQQEQV